MAVVVVVSGGVGDREGERIRKGLQEAAFVTRMNGRNALPSPAAAVGVKDRRPTPCSLLQSNKIIQGERVGLALRLRELATRQGYDELSQPWAQILMAHPV